MISFEGLVRKRLKEAHPPCIVSTLLRAFYCLSGALEDVILLKVGSIALMICPLFLLLSQMGMRLA